MKKILVVAVLFMNGIASANSYISTGEAGENIEPRQVREQPKGGECMYAGVKIAVGDTIRLTSIGITQACVAGDDGPVAVTIVEPESKH